MWIIIASDRRSEIMLRKIDSARSCDVNTFVRVYTWVKLRHVLNQHCVCSCISIIFIFLYIAAWSGIGSTDFGAISCHFMVLLLYVLRDPIIGGNSFRQSLKTFLFTAYWRIQCIRGFMMMRYINRLFTYLLIYLFTLLSRTAYGLRVFCGW